MEWISVNECLPELSEKAKKLSEPNFEMCSVIAYGRMKGGFGSIVKETNRYCTHKTGTQYLDEITEKDNREFDKWYWSDGWEEVTHWMPLPEPPKE